MRLQASINLLLPVPPADLLDAGEPGVPEPGQDRSAVNRIIRPALRGLQHVHCLIEITRPVKRRTAVQESHAQVIKGYAVL